ncbi:MAG: molecular chaperone OsmY [Gammaproteobacteria bacterium]
MKKAAMILGASLYCLGIIGCQPATGAEQNTAYVKAGKAQQVAGDSMITAKVKAKYAADPVLKMTQVEVKTEQGVVYLSGVVEAEVAYQKAIIDAINTNGVKEVDATDLYVKTSKIPLQDLAILSYIKGEVVKYNREHTQTLNVSNVRLEVNDGKIFLVGTMENRFQRRELLKLVKKTPRVKDIKHSIEIVEWDKLISIT